MTPEAFAAGTLVVARLRDAADGLVAEPVSLVRSGSALAVDALYFDTAPVQGLTAQEPHRIGPRARYRGCGGRDPLGEPSHCPQRARPGPRGDGSAR
jgi:hypothetical protein